MTPKRWSRSPAADSSSAARASSTCSGPTYDAPELARLVIGGKERRLRVRRERRRDVGPLVLFGLLLELRRDRVRIDVDLAENVTHDLVLQGGVEQVVAVEIEAPPLERGVGRTLQKLASGVAKELGDVDPLDLALPLSRPRGRARRRACVYASEKIGEELVEEAAPPAEAARHPLLGEIQLAEVFGLLCPVRQQPNPGGDCRSSMSFTDRLLRCHALISRRGRMTKPAPTVAPFERMCGRSQIGSPGRRTQLRPAASAPPRTRRGVAAALLCSPYSPEANVVAREVRLGPSHRPVSDSRAGDRCDRPPGLSGVRKPPANGRLDHVRHETHRPRRLRGAMNPLGRSPRDLLDVAGEVGGDLNRISGTCDAGRGDSTELEMSVNGHTLGTAEDDRFGEFVAYGFYVYSSTGDAEIRFDNFEGSGSSND